MSVDCNWLLSRWRLLTQTNPTEWTDEQRTQASSLIGGDPSIDPLVDGFAAQQVTVLETR